MQVPITCSKHTELLLLFSLHDPHHRAFQPAIRTRRNGLWKISPHYPVGVMQRSSHRRNPCRSCFASPATSTILPFGDLIWATLMPLRLIHDPRVTMADFGFFPGLKPPWPIVAHLLRHLLF